MPLTNPNDSIATTANRAKSVTDFSRSSIGGKANGSPTSVRMFSSTSGSSSATPSPDHENHNPRSCILQVGVSTGRLCGIANSHLMEQQESGIQRPETTTTTNTISSRPKRMASSSSLVLAMSELLLDLYRTSQSFQLNLVVCVHAKLELNRKKYPVELCKGKATKYTQYSQITGVTKTNQSTSSFVSSATSPLPTTWFHNSLLHLVEAVPDLAQTIQDFAQARAWAPFHTPRNLVLALLGEVGELAEILQWEGELDNDNVDNDDNEDNVTSSTTTRRTVTESQKDKLSQELADVTIYLLRLATVTHTVSDLVETLRLQVEDESQGES